MTHILISPKSPVDCRLSVGTSGGESLEFQAALDGRMSVKFTHGRRKFPREGRVLVQRGSSVGNGGAGEFRVVEESYDEEEGVAIPEHFFASLHLHNGAYDRLVQRLNLGPPDLLLSFAMSSSVISYTAKSGSSWDVDFNVEVKPWEKVESATLTQRVAHGASANQ